MKPRQLVPMARCAACWSFLLALGLSTSCDSGKIHIVVEASGVPTSTTTLVVRALVDGHKTEEEARFDIERKNPVKLGVMLPLGAGEPGRTRLSVAALDAHGCLLAVGSMMEKELGAGSSAQASVALQAFPAIPWCGESEAVLLEASKPVISAFAPAGKERSLTLTGWGFHHGTRVFLGEVEQCATLQSFTQMTIPVPVVRPMVPGPLRLSLRAPDGTTLAESHTLLSVEIESPSVRLSKWATLPPKVIAKALFRKGERLALVTSDGVLHLREKKPSSACDAVPVGTCPWAFEPITGSALPIAGLVFSAEDQGVLLTRDLPGGGKDEFVLVSSAGSAAFTVQDDRLTQTWTRSALMATSATLLQGDHSLDLVVAEPSGLNVYRRQAPPNPVFAATPVNLTAKPVRDVTAAAFGLDDKQEGLAALVVVDCEDPRIAICEALQIWFSSAAQPGLDLKFDRIARVGNTMTARPGILTAADLNGDGHLDVLVNGSPQLWMRQNAPPGPDAFKPIFLKTAGNKGGQLTGADYGVAVRDLNGDGLADLLFLDAGVTRFARHAGPFATTEDFIAFADPINLEEPGMTLSLTDHVPSAHRRILGYGPDANEQSFLVIGSYVLAFTPPPAVKAPACPSRTTWAPVQPPS